MHRTFHSTCRLTLVAAAIVATLVGCQTKPKTSDRDIVRVDFERVRLMMIATERAHQALLVDPRPTSHRRVKTIQGSVHIPIQDMTANDPRLAETGHIVVFGSDWQDDLSSAAAKRLIALGYENVLDFRGGVAEWEKNGGSVVRIEPPADATAN